MKKIYLLFIAILFTSCSQNQNYLLEEGEKFGIKPFGVETQRILRLEKGHLIPGTDTDALSSPYETGVGFAI